jgi:hypothetical protein
MKKRVFVWLTGIVMTFALTACSSLDVSKNFNTLGIVGARTQPIAQINAQVYGVFFLDAFPLFCGSVNTTDKTAIFVNTVKLDNTMGLVTRTARGLGATKLANLNSYYSSRWLWYTLLFWERQTQVSATAIK